MQKTALSFANVSKHFGETRAVHDLTFQVRKGEVVGFVGPNGAGKTATIGMLMGYISASRGTIMLGDHSIRPSSAHRYHKDVGFVSGDMALYDNLTGSQYLDFVSSRSNLDTAFKSELLDQLKPVLNKRIKTLSRGNKQKVALIGALQHNPGLLVLDEPTSGLDPLMQDTFLSIISDHAKKGATVFMSSHILSEVAPACSRVLFMKDGKIIIDKAVEDIERESGKLITIAAPAHIIKAASAHLPDSSQLLSSGQTKLTFVYKGEITPLLRWLSTRPLEDILIEERSLDDIFKDQYKDDRKKTS